MIFDSRFTICDLRFEMSRGRLRPRTQRCVAMGRAALLFCILLLCLGCRSQKSREQELENIRSLLHKVDAYRDKHFPPPNWKAYQRVFGEPVVVPSSTIPSSPELYNAMAAPLRRWTGEFLVSPQAIAATPELRYALEAYYQHTEPKWQMVQQAIAGGGYYLSFAEEERLSFPYAYLNWHTLSTFARDNCLKGLFFLATNRPTEGITQFSMGLKLGKRLFGKTFTGGWIGARIISISCAGYDHLLWRPMDAEIARYALTSCQGFEIPIREHCEAAVAGELLIFARPLLQGPRRLEWWPDTLTIGMFLWDTSFYGQGSCLSATMMSRCENRRWLERMKRMAGSKRAAYYFKITTAPAIRKRLRHILATEPDYQNNPMPAIFDKSDFKDLSPQLEILLRAQLRYDIYSAAPFISVLSAVAKLEMLRVALAARVFRAEKDRWPTDVAELQAADLISTPVIHFPGPLTIVDLYSNYGQTPEKVDRLVAAAILDSVHLKIVPVSQAPLISNVEQADGQTILSIQDVKISRAETDLFMKSLAAFAPLVENIRLSRFTSSTLTVADTKNPFPLFPPPDSPIYTSMTIEASFKRPKHFWVVYSWGPDGKDDGGIVVYDRKNGPTSAGDIVQIIGWE